VGAAGGKKKKEEVGILKKGQDPTRGQAKVRGLYEKKLGGGRKKERSGERE